MNYPEVTIGAPVRNRAWILGTYLDKLVKLDYPKDKIRFLFILNDSSDESDRILKEFKERYEGEYRGVEIQEYNQGAVEDARYLETRLRIHESLARVRNRLIKQVTDPFFFSVDTDILVRPDTLKILLDSRKDIVAAVISNDYVERPEAAYPYFRSNLLIKNKDGKIVHYLKYPLNSLFQVYVTGAVYLLTREVCEQVEYGPDPQGEDVYFCRMAWDKGFEVWANSRAFCYHIMIVYQGICMDCVWPCKAPRIKDNRILPRMTRCPKRVRKSEEQRLYERLNRRRDVSLDALGR